MAEEHVRRRKKKFDDNISTMLLSNVYFLGGHNAKFLLIGYSAAKDMRPLMIFCHENSCVEFTLPDWITLTSNSRSLNDCQNTDGESEAFVTKNVSIKKVAKSGNMFIQIQNKASNSILLSLSEYNKCVEMNLFVQNIMKTFQANWIEIEDYYNYYVHRCNVRKKNVLDEQDFFTVENANFDVYRLFKEISIFCFDKLQSDLTFIS